MKRPTIHTARITHDQAACTCRSWVGPSRLVDAEPIGVYTLRAYAAHAQHVADVETAPPDLFTPADDAAPAPFGLFAD